MMLYELFSWLRTSEGDKDIHPEIVSLSEVQNEKNQAETVLRQLLYKYRSQKYAPSKYISSDHINEISELLIAILQQEDFIRFLDFSLEKLEKQGSCTQVELGLDFLFSSIKSLAQTKFHDEKSCKLFLSYLNYNEAKAVSLYQDKSSQLAKNIFFKFSETLTHYYLTELKLLLKEQKNPLGIVPFCKQYIDNIEKYAAFTLYFLERKVENNALIESGILHDLLLYNLPEIGLEHNELRRFYELLGCYSEGKELIKIAKDISSGMEGFNAYSLVGSLEREENLKEITLQKPVYDFSYSINNFNALYHLFGNDFLVAAIASHAQQKNIICNNFLKKIFGEKLTVDELVHLIRKLAVSHIELLPIFCGFLSDEQFEKLLENKVPEILHFIPYKKDLCHKIGFLEVQQYLQKMSQEMSSHYELLPSLLSLLDEFSKSNQKIADLIYENILDLLISQPQLLDDDAIYKCMKKYRGKIKVIEKKCKDAETAFNDCLISQTSQYPFLIQHYHIIEDAWVKAKNTVSCLKNLFRFSHHIPKDKYLLQGYVARCLLIQQGETWRLDRFTNMLEVKPSLETDQETAYERILFAILVSLDDEKTRCEIIGKLEEKYSHEKDILDNKIASLFITAVKENNTSLVAWILNNQKIEISSTSLSNAFELSAIKKQWQMVELFINFKPERIDRQKFKSVMILAASCGQANFLKKMYEKHCDLLKQEIIDKAFLAAAEKNQLEVLQFLAELNTLTPCNSVLIKGLVHAFGAGNYNAVKLIGNLRECHLIACKIESLLNLAAKNKKYTELALLLNLNKNSPSRMAIEKIFERACALGQLFPITLLMTLDSNKPCKGSIQNGLLLSAKRGHLHVVKYLCKNHESFDIEILKSAQRKASKAGFEAVCSYLNEFINHQQQSSCACKKRIVYLNKKGLGFFQDKQLKSEQDQTTLTKNALF